MDRAAVQGLGTATEVAGGYSFNCARFASGGVACWGSNEAGQLGSMNPGAPAGTPVTIPGL